jgi:SAM-dependent methyltransferase
MRVGPGNFGRYAMYKQLQACFRAGPVPENARVLSISHSRYLISLLTDRPCEITEANYPDCNILNLPFADNEFDLVVSDQVFEHIEGNPQRAMDETLRVVKPGGRVVHTTCFQIPYHGPGDYWRYTPEGLAYLCRQARKVDQAAGWGHPLVPLVTGLGLGWADVPEARWHPFHWLATVNWPSYVHVVWVVATK